MGARSNQVSLSLARLVGLGALYILGLARLLDARTSAWLFIAIVACLVALLLFSHRRYTRDTERYYDLLTPQELEWEVQRSRQALARSLTIWCGARSSVCSKPT